MEETRENHAALFKNNAPNGSQWRIVMGAQKSSQTKGDMQRWPDWISITGLTKFAATRNVFSQAKTCDAIGFASNAKGEIQMTKNKSVLGIYTSRSAVETGITYLRDAGFASTDVSILLPENLGPRELATEKGTKAPEGTAAGAGSGAVIGGALGWLAGIGALAIPGIGPFLAAGPIMATLAGIGVGGAIGGFTGALVGLGIPEYEAKRYEGRLVKGGILASVHCDTSEEIDRAKEVLKRTGAEDVSSTSESSARAKTEDISTARRVGR
jgi:hypothetical protein